MNLAVSFNQLCQIAVFHRWSEWNRLVLIGYPSGQESSLRDRRLSYLISFYRAPEGSTRARARVIEILPLP